MLTVTMWGMTSRGWGEFKMGTKQVVINDKGLAKEMVHFSFSLHPTLPVYATTSGQRKYPKLSDDESSSIFEKDGLARVDNSLRLWWLDGKGSKPNE